MDFSPKDFFARNPEISYLFNPNMLENLLADSNSPFAHDQEYLLTQGALFILLEEINNTRAFVKADYRFSMNKSIDFSQVQEHLDLLSQLKNYVVNMSSQRLTAIAGGGFIPRTVRLVERLEFTQKESWALGYMVLYYSDSDFYNRFQMHDSLGDLGMLLEMSSRELVKFIDLERAHIEQGIMEVEESGNLLQREFKIPEEVARILSGCRVTAKDLLTLSETVLYDLLAEEPQTEQIIKSGDLERSREEEIEEEIEEEGLSEELLDNVLEDNDQDSEQDDEGHDLLDDLLLEPFQSDLDYLEEYFELIALKIRMAKTEQDDDSFRLSTEKSKEARLREFRVLERIQQSKCEKRTQLTLKNGKWLPRLESLIKERGLEPFEKMVLLTLTGATFSTDMIKALDSFTFKCEVGELLELFCDSLEERIQYRRYFYKDATLLKEGMIRLSDAWDMDLTRCDVEIDRRMLDYIVGLDTELSELVEGSHLYYPRVKIEQVILPDEQKELITETVSNFSKFSQARLNLGFDELIPYGRSMIMLFYGPSGTGKTMMANAIANYLGKKVLLINYTTLGGNFADETIKFILRECRINDAILFFDECESLFEDRSLGNSDIGVLLTELERHDGLIIMATNRAFDLDEAMHRRITLCHEFRRPDPHFRQKIWNVHLPQDIKMRDQLDLKELAWQYELTGGFIKNAVLSALSLAVARNVEDLQITQADLEKGAKLQLRSHLQMTDFDRRVVPLFGLDGLVLTPLLRKILEQIIQFEKARNVLFSQWGFDEKLSYGQGMAALFHGPPGTGKSITAEAIGFQLGKPLKVINTAEVLSKYVGESSKNIDAIFKDARANDSIIVFDEADGLFGARTAVSNSTDRYANIDVGLLLYNIERFPGLIILTTNLFKNIDEAFLRRMKFILEFDIPDRELREQLWKKLSPAKMPLAEEVNFFKLAARYTISGGHIKNAVFKAAAKAALRSEQERKVTMQDLMEAAESEVEGSKSKKIGF